VFNKNRHYGINPSCILIFCQCRILFEYELHALHNGQTDSCVPRVEDESSNQRLVFPGHLGIKILAEFHSRNLYSATLAATAFAALLRIEVKNPLTVELNVGAPALRVRALPFNRKGRYEDYSITGCLLINLFDERNMQQ